MWTSSIATAARTARSAAESPAAISTSSGLSRLPPAARVASASVPRLVPCPIATSASRSSTSAMRSGSQVPAVSITAVTGAGMDERVIPPGSRCGWR